MTISQGYSLMAPPSDELIIDTGRYVVFKTNATPVLIDL